MRASHAAEEEEAPAEDQQDELGDGELGELFPPLVDSEADPDDEAPTDPYVGLELPPEDAGDDWNDGTEISGFEQGLSPFGFDEKFEEQRGSDEFGIEGERGAGLEFEPEESGKRDDALDGPERDVPAIDEAELPGLDADESGAIDLDVFGSLPSLASEASFPSAEPSWRCDRFGPEREGCTALTVGHGVVVAGSSDLFWFDAGSELPVRLGAEGSRLSSLALAGEGGGFVLGVTVAGRLFRRARRGSEVERLLGWRRAAEAAGVSAETLELCQVGGGSGAVLGRLASGRVVRSRDDGSSFELLAPEVTAIAMSTGGSPIVLLSRDGISLRLSNDAGSSWETRRLDAVAREVAGGEAPLVAAGGQVVVLADAERGLAISGDGGRTFRSVPGTTNVSACAAGMLDGRSVGYAAVYREAADESQIILVDAETAAAQALGTLSGDGDGGSELDGERGRVERLSSDGEALWAAGGFGVARFRRSLGQ